MNVKQFIDRTLSLGAVGLLVPTFLILASWNALPGDRLYPVKTGLEDATILLLKGTSSGRYLSVRYTKRRFQEANQLLRSRFSTEGYPLLIAEARESKELIVGSEDAKNAQILSQDITTYRQEIQKTQSELAGALVQLETTERELSRIESELQTVAQENTL